LLEALIVALLSQRQCVGELKIGRRIAEFGGSCKRFNRALASS